MSTVFVFPNNVNTTLASPITSGDTTITLSSSAGLPTLLPGQTLAITLNDAATRLVFEVVYVPYPGISGATLSGCLRGQEGTTAQSWSTSDIAFAGITMGMLDSFQQTAAPYIGNPVAWANWEGTTTNNFSTLTQLNATSYKIPANTLVQGSVIRLNAWGLYSVTGSPTLNLEWQIGGQTTGSSGATTTGGSSQAFSAEYSAICTTTGSSGNLAIISGAYYYRVNNTAGPYVGIGNSVTIDTTADNYVTFWGQFSVASVSNTVTLQAWMVQNMQAGAVVT